MELFTENMQIADVMKQNSCENALTMAFVNIQPFAKTYSLSEGLKRGTIFPDIDKPFLGGGDRR